MKTKNEKYVEVVQTGFDIAITDGVTNQDLQDLAEQIKDFINEFITIEGKPMGVACVNGVHSYEDMTDVYSGIMDELQDNFTLKLS
jgi:hypothetical protein